MPVVTVYATDFPAVTDWAAGDRLRLKSFPAGVPATWSRRPAVCVTEPFSAFNWTTASWRGVEAGAAVSVNVEGEPALTLGRSKAAVTPAGRLPTERLIVCAPPLAIEVEIDTATLAPAATAAWLGAMETVKSVGSNRCATQAAAGAVALTLLEKRVSTTKPLTVTWAERSQMSAISALFTSYQPSGKSTNWPMPTSGSVIASASSCDDVSLILSKAAVRT